MSFLRQFINHFTGDSDSSQNDIRIIDGEVIYPEHFNAPEELEEIPTSRSKKKSSQKTDILSLNDLLHHKDLKKGYVPIGLSKKNGDLIQSTWKRMTTGVIAGRRNHGKSGILKAMVLLALHAKKKGLHCKIYLFDPHHNLPDASGTFFKPILDQFDECFLGMESLERGRHLTLFKDLKMHVQSFQKDGFDEKAPWHFIFIDESDLFFKEKTHGKKNYYYIEHLINLRKGRIFFLLSFADTTKSGSGNIGTGLIAAGTTVFCVNYDLTRARLVLQGPGEAQKAINLPVGYAAVKIPDEKKVNVCRMPYVTNEDLLPFLPANQQAPTIKDGKILGFNAAPVLERNGIRIYSPSSKDEDEPTIERLSKEAIRIEIEKLAQMMDTDEEEIEFESPIAHEKPDSEKPEGGIFLEEEAIRELLEDTSPSSSDSSQETPSNPYFTKDDQDDFDGFLTWLETSGKSQRTVAEYGRGTKTWKRILASEITADSILNHLKSLSYTKAVRMKTVIGAYADYRHSIGDSELKILLTLNPFTPPAKPEEQPQNGSLSEKEIAMYWTTAKELCKGGDRVGIWVGLSLLGVQPSEIRNLRILNKRSISVQRRKKAVSVQCPPWLMGAMKDIADWRQGRKTIHTGVKQYETTPSSLNSATHRSKLDKLKSAPG